MMTSANRTSLPRDAAASELSMAPATILIVDDQPENLQVLSELLQPHYYVRAARSGEQALRAAGSDPKPDLILLDIMMPGMDGFQVLAKLRENPSTVDIPVIFVTALETDEDEQHGFDMGAVDYITKPIRPPIVLARIRTHLELKLIRESLADQNTQLEKRVLERTRQLQQANQGLNLANERLHQNFLVTIKIFSNLMELRKGTVGGHARRVADLAQRLANQMGLDPGIRQDVFIAGLLHDIGKIGFSDALFATPMPKLNAKELGLYRKHTLDGANTLMPLSELSEVARIVRSHHERFDGSGFPDGLDGERIPLGSRILAVTNDYDGLQIGTVLERKLTAQEAGKMIAYWRNEYYDPQVVDAFLELMTHPPLECMDEREVSVYKLQPGMVLAKDLLRTNGMLLIAADYVLDEKVIRSLQYYARQMGMELTLRIRTTASPQKGSGTVTGSGDPSVGG